MAKVKTHSLNPREKYEIIGDFFEIISNLRNKKEVIDFFIGLLTPSESLMMARRIQIANKIIKGKSYEDIRRELKVGFNTIYKTDRWLNNEDEEYSKWIKNVIAKPRKTDKINVSGSMLDRYAHHRFFKKMLK